MKSQIIHTCTIILLYFFPVMVPAGGQTIFDFETGVVFSGYNDVRIPGDQGTLFSSSKELDASPKVFYRVRAGYTFHTRHNLSLLYAPLAVKSNGSIPRDLTFEGVVFPANTTLIGFYKFNSYRLTYRYDIVEKTRWNGSQMISCRFFSREMLLQHLRAGLRMFLLPHVTGFPTRLV
jgi:hypothetical protein